MGRVLKLFVFFGWVGGQGRYSEGCAGFGVGGGNFERGLGLVALDFCLLECCVPA